MHASRTALESLFRAELEQPALPAAAALADAIRARHGDAVLALLFYGSCLRRGTPEGVLDFYVVVASYRGAYRSRLPALAAGLLPPNVHYVELVPQNLRAKYALISLVDFERSVAPASLDCRVWARFCQPARIVWARDEATRAALVAAAAHAAVTMTERMLAFAPEDSVERTLELRALWTRGFRETYRAELRSESPETIAELYGADARRYDRVAREAVRALAAEGRLRVAGESEGALTIVEPPRELASARRAWRWRRPVAKALAIAGLLKTAFTFDGWLPYVVWKLERQSGASIELSERQRRRPLLFAWPVILRLLRDGVLR